MASARNVLIERCNVMIRGLKQNVDREYGELVRVLSSNARALVKYAPRAGTLAEMVTDTFSDALLKGEAEQHLKAVQRDFDGAEAQSFEDNVFNGEFVKGVTTRLASKTKRIKQHFRRAKARAQKAGREQVQHEWPVDLALAAEDVENWNEDVFMHVAMRIMAAYFTKRGLQVKVYDGIHDYELRGNIQMLIENHGQHAIGIREYVVLPSR